MKTEIESKLTLQKYGIKTTDPRIATDADQASQHAFEIGGDLVLKIVSADIVHKVAAGGVRLNVDADHAASAYYEIVSACRASAPDARIDGVLVEKMVASEGEIFIGGRIDPEYGPIVLLGIGGSGVEEGAPPSASLAPIDQGQASQLLEASLPKPLQSLMSERAREELIEYLLKIGGADGLLMTEQLDELDINPVVLNGDELIVVDAVLGERVNYACPAALPVQLEDEIKRRLSQQWGMGALFGPESIAFIGASTSPSKLGYRNIKNLIDLGFSGDLYPIHPSAEEICGVRAYPSLADAPCPVDRAYIALGADKVPTALAECARHGVKIVQVLTAGFSEYGTGEHGDNTLVDALRGSNTRMVGPNCIGTFSARGRIPMGAARFCPEAIGGITFISQSGTYAGDVVRRAQVQGIPVSQVLSCGNCADLDIIDYLLFCDRDENTSLIAFYVESLSQAGLFFRLAEQISKPIVILRGGMTNQGMAAASSHTAALATDRSLWTAGIAQAGILQVDSLDELMDALLIHSAHYKAIGNRLGIFGSGGGVSVTSSDAAERLGLSVPSLEAKTAKSLEHFGVPGTSVANPIDIPVWGLRDGDGFILDDVINLLKADAHIDSVIVYIEMGSIMDFADDDAAGLKELYAICDSVQSVERSGSPVTLVLRSTGDRVQEDFIREVRPKMLEKGIAVFASTTRAIRAHSELHRMMRKSYRTGNVLDATVSQIDRAVIGR